MWSRSRKRWVGKHALQDKVWHAKGGCIGYDGGMFEGFDDKRITAIAPTKRDPQRGMLKVDGKVVATLSYKLIADMGLGVDDLWTDELARRVERAAAFDKALKAAMNRINRRAMSSGQLGMKLKEKEHGEEAIADVVEYLTELGVLDDRAYGEALMRELVGRKPAGPSLLRQKMYQKGLRRELIDELVREYVENNDQGELALKFALVKIRSMKRLDVATKKRRLWGALARRGFDSSAIGWAFEELGDLGGEEEQWD